MGPRSSDSQNKGKTFLQEYVLRDTRYYEVRLLSVARFGKEELPAAIK